VKVSIAFARPAQPELNRALLRTALETLSSMGVRHKSAMMIHPNPIALSGPD
jgi:hypothetical protein